MTIKLDPNTGMYVVPELMEQGPVPQPHNFRPSPDPQGPDTVRADLTPGEAVIPAPVAQDPAYKPAIEQMVAEGRGRNDAMRGGTTDVPAYNEGNVSIPFIEDDQEDPFADAIVAQEQAAFSTTGALDNSVPGDLLSREQRIPSTGLGLGGSKFTDKWDALPDHELTEIANFGDGHQARVAQATLDRRGGIAGQHAGPVDKALDADGNIRISGSDEVVPITNKPTEAEGDIPKPNNGKQGITLPDGTVVGGESDDFVELEDGTMVDRGTWEDTVNAYATGARIEGDMSDDEKDKAQGFFSRMWENAFGAPPEGKDAAVGLLTFAGALFTGIGAPIALAMAAGAAGIDSSNRAREDELLEAEETKALQAEQAKLQPDLTKPIDLIDTKSQKQVTGFEVPGTDKYRLSDGKVVSRDKFRERSAKDDASGAINHLRIQGGWSGGVAKKDKKGKQIFSSDGQPIYETAYDDEEMLADWITHNQQAIGLDGKRFGEQGARLAASPEGQSKLRDISDAAKEIFSKTGKEIKNFAGLFEANDIGVNVNNRDRLLTADGKDMVDAGNFKSIRQGIDSNNAKRREKGLEPLTYRVAMSNIDAALDTNEDAKEDYRKWLESKPTIPKGSSAYLEYVKLQIKMNGENI